MRKIPRRKTLFLLAVLLVVSGSLISTFYFYQKYQQIKNNPQAIAKEEIASVTDVIARFMDLPADEEPTLATVTDQEVLKDQNFFKNAQNGDKVLIYTKAHKAILYRPSTGRVIEFASLTFGAENTPE